MLPWRAIMWLHFAILTVLVNGNYQTSVDDQGLHVDTASDGSYKISVAGKVWLTSAPTFVHAAGKQHSTANGTMKLMGEPRTSEGQDSVGGWRKVAFKYGFTDAALAGKVVEMSVKSYMDDKHVLIFEQFFPSSLVNTSAGDEDQVISAFPAFNVEDRVPLGVLSYGGMFFWHDNTIQRYGRGMPQIAHGLDGGIVTLFDEVEGHTLVMSAYNNFMSTSVNHDTAAETLSWGPMGQVGSVPAGYRAQTVLYHTDRGINKAVAGWGDLLLHIYGKDHVTARGTDPSLNYLGYYTDNGDYYYHMTEPGMNAEETILSVFKESRQKNIPYGFLQYDDWWYFVTPPSHGDTRSNMFPGYGNTLRWEPRPEVFPHGMQYIYNITRLPVLAHNREWSSQTPFADFNGGPYKFLKSANKDLTIPLEQALWDHIFSFGVQWGLAVYEQDFLISHFHEIPELHQDLFLARTWLMQMGQSAAQYGLRMEYCMALPRFALQSVEIPAVTQIRVSGDHVDMQNPKQWKIGVSSILAISLGLAPIKDTFWTETEQPGNRYHQTELSPALQAVVSLLSTGPVGPGDRLNHTNATLLRSLAMSDGRLLKPSRGMTAIDSQIKQLAFGGSAGPKGEVYTTHSEVSGSFFGIVLAAEMQEAYKLSPADAGFPDSFPDSVVYKYPYKPSSTAELPIFNAASPLVISNNCTVTDFCLFFTAPRWSLGSTAIAMFGELDKVVPVSPVRVQNIDVGTDDILVTLNGIENEAVTFWFVVGMSFESITCNFGPSRVAMISIAAKTCYV